MNEFYWELKYGDFKEPRSVMIAPDTVAALQRRWDNGQNIHLKTGTVPANQIRSFEITDKPFGEQRLIESAAQAFKEPIFHGDAIEVKWVKQIVTRDKHARHYSQIPGYRYLGEDNGMAVIAFRKATHEIDPSVTPYCTEDEINTLTRT